jgi:hypothetical protein
MFASSLQLVASVGLLLGRGFMSEAFHLINVATTSAEGHMFHAEPNDDEYMEYSTDYVEDLKEFLKPMDPASALTCESFTCFLSKFDLMKTELGYTLKEMKVWIEKPITKEYFVIKVKLNLLVWVL